MRRGTNALWLAGAFVAVVASFLAATLYSEHRARAIHGAAVSIARKASPSIQLLASLRTELRRLAMEAAAYGAGGMPEQREELRRTRDQIADTLVAYLALPPYPEENELARRLGEDLRGLHGTLERLLAADAEAPPPQRAPETIRNRLEPWLTRAQASAHEVLDLNASRARDLALRIDATRDRASRLALTLDGISIVLAILAATLAVLAIRQGTRRLEEQRDELDAFAGRVAHDILGPLGSARLWIEMTQRQGAGGERDERSLQRAIDSVTQCGSIVQALFEFARSGARPDRRAVADLAAVLPGAAAELRPEAEAAEAELSIDVPSPCPVRCTAGACACILSNLVRNALKYLGDAEVRRVEVRARRVGPRVLVEVADSGPGIPADLQSTLFEPFVRGVTKGKPGLGLGLATVKRLVEGYGGRVWLESEPGHGARFWFELPAASAAPSKGT